MTWDNCPNVWWHYIWTDLNRTSILCITWGRNRGGWVVRSLSQVVKRLFSKVNPFTLPIPDLYIASQKKYRYIPALTNIGLIFRTLCRGAFHLPPLVCRMYREIALGRHRADIWLGTSLILGVLWRSILLPFMRERVPLVEVVPSFRGYESWPYIKLSSHFCESYVLS